MNTYRWIFEISTLPEEVQVQLKDYIDFLKQKYGSKKESEPERKKLSYSWEGGLEELRGEYTSVELQHEIIGSS